MPKLEYLDGCNFSSDSLLECGLELPKVIVDCMTEFLEPRMPDQIPPPLDTRIRDWTKLHSDLHWLMKRDGLKRTIKTFSIAMSEDHIRIMVKEPNDA